jgi:tRNA A37 threonylcarbamoyladenosine biosynthesis protein TsaE
MEKNNFILRHCELIAYPDKISENEIQITCSLYTTIKEWAYILHDKDTNEDGTPKAPHYHIYLNFGNATDTELVASWFKLKKKDIQKIKGRKSDILKYLTHKNAPTKYQYDKALIKTNIPDEQFNAPDDIIGDFQNYSYAQMLNSLSQYINSNERIKQHKKLKDLWHLECELLTLKGDRQMRVIFVNGETATGKTTWAKSYCRLINKDYYISSASNDPMQDYKGQKVMILDDLRDNVYKFDDLIKLLDNHTSSTSKSRYMNKVFNGDTIIITSSKPLHKWYNGIESSVPDESLRQLYRRISEYIEITPDNIKTWSKVENGYPVGTPLTIDNYISVMYLDEHEQNDAMGSAAASILRHPEVQKLIQKKIENNKKLLSAKRKP